MKLFLIGFVSLVRLFGQFSDLASTDDGAQLYFSSPLRLKTGDENYNPKVLRYVGAFENVREAANGPDTSPWRSAYFQTIHPQVSGGGTVVAWGADAVCTSGVDCLNAQPTEHSFIAGAALPPIFDYGGIRLSGDGRFALNSYEPNLDSVVDLRTLTVTPLYPYSETADGNQSFTDSGAILLLAPSGGLALWNLTAPLQLSTSRKAVFAGVSRNGAKVVYEPSDAIGPALIVYDVASGHETVIATASLQNFRFHPFISIDGSLVLFVAPDSSGTVQAFLIQTTGSGLRQLTHEPEGVTEATLSGYGNVAFAATPLARLLRIDTASGAVTELGRSAAATSLSAAAPGSLAQLNGFNLATVTSVLVNDRPAPAIP